MLGNGKRSISETQDPAANQDPEKPKEPDHAKNVLVFVLRADQSQTYDELMASRLTFSDTPTLDDDVAQEEDDEAQGGENDEEQAQEADEPQDLGLDHEEAERKPFN